MALVSMKIQPKDRDAQEYGTSIAVDRPEYPWGLSISLDDDALEKLGITDLPSVGGAVNVTAIARITSVSSSERMDGEKCRSIGLQITDLSLDPPLADPASTLYK